MSIYEVPAGRRYWVVRAESGKFYDHFIQNGVIALGHLNCLNVAEQDTYIPDLAELSERFHNYHLSKNNKRQRASVHLAQLKSFIYDMKVGDWVLTVGRSGVRYGRVLGKPYVKKGIVRVTYDEETNNYVDMDYNLRREVQWGPLVKRKLLPYGLVQSLKANQTVFCLDKNWQAVYHSIYPAFKFENQLYLSANIRTQKDIKNYSVTSFFKLLNEVEVIGKEFSERQEISNFEQVFDSYLSQDNLTITTKAQFHSPGEIWNTIQSFVGPESLDTWQTYTVLAYGMIFGNQKLGFDGIIDLETRKKLWDLVIERMKVNKVEESLKSLDLELPDADTSKLEDSSNDKV
ncbi:hypothetical protein Shal_1789 [Shewanella halifaxensis HAW-EB4]|uniref:Uncharacterized protein n=1 Tax=Shewanella halifaxensis (strain HAW-EB4) TaxID=458817 RepID=B0TQV9_SHEHH|nr:hypothetical protein [Shewanella halifaxensis]ABZ76354.1 hypothetical protein Shal_1789 [Shewanella halifaxensis HAW-EB4]